MRILYFHQYFATPDGSTGTRSYEFARRLVEFGHEVTVITSQAALRVPRGSAGTFQVEGVDIVALDVPYAQSMSFFRRKLAFAEFAVRAAGAARRHRADIVFATSTPLTIAIPGVWTARRQKVPFVLEVRDLWPMLPVAIGALRNPVTRAGAYALERWAYRSAQHIVALSPGMVAGIESVGIPRTRISMIPNSSDVSLFSSANSDRADTRATLGLSESDALVLYAGSFGRSNKVGYLVRIAQEAATMSKHLRFLLVGSGSEFEDVERLARRAGVLGKNMEILPPMPKRDLVRMFGAADVVASVFAPIPALRNNSANKFFDGLAAGRPVAINYGGWQAEVLSDAQAGVVLPPADPRVAAQQLVEYTAHGDRLEAAGRNALALANSRFSRERHVQELEAILSNQYELSQHRPGSPDS